MTALVQTPSSQCPQCAAPLDGEAQWDQGALFLHGGYGATERTVYRSCRACGWSLTAEVSSVSPRSDPPYPSPGPCAPATSTGAPGPGARQRPGRD